MTSIDGTKKARRTLFNMGYSLETRAITKAHFMQDEVCGSGAMPSM